MSEVRSVFFCPVPDDELCRPGLPRVQVARCYGDAVVMEWGFMLCGVSSLILLSHRAHGSVKLGSVAPWQNRLSDRWVRAHSGLGALSQRSTHQPCFLVSVGRICLTVTDCLRPPGCLLVAVVCLFFPADVFVFL